METGACGDAEAPVSMNRGSGRSLGGCRSRPPAVPTCRLTSGHQRPVDGGRGVPPRRLGAGHVQNSLPGGDLFGGVCRLRAGAVPCGVLPWGAA